jgi:putative flippase GtrA
VRLAPSNWIETIALPAARLYKRFERVIRYCLVGGVTTLSYTLLTAGFISGHLIADPTLASAIASAIVIPLSFLIHRRITYADVTPERAQWKRYLFIAVSNFVIATGSMKLVSLAGWPYWIALVIGWVVIPIVNYTVNAVWVFQAKRLLSLDRAASPTKAGTRP